MRFSFWRGQELFRRYSCGVIQRKHRPQPRGLVGAGGDDTLAIERLVALVCLAKRRRSS